MNWTLEIVVSMNTLYKISKLMYTKQDVYMCIYNIYIPSTSKSLKKTDSSRYLGSAHRSR